MRRAIVAAALAAWITTVVVSTQATTYYVDSAQAECPAACLDGDAAGCTEPNNGLSLANAFCRIPSATTATASGDTVNIAGSTVPYRGKIEESQTGVSYIGLGDHPTDHIITSHRNTTLDSLTISAEAGRTNVCKFSPGATVYSIHELGRETDLNRTIPAAAAANANGSEDDGVSAYFAWHVRDSWTTDYFGGAEPATLAGILDIVEDVEGSWAQDDADWGNTNVVYFHPMANRACNTFSMEYEKDSDIAGNFILDSTTIRNLSFFGVSAGNQGRNILGGAVALRVGGDSTTVEDVWTFNADLSVSSTNGLSNFTLDDFVATAGFSGSSNALEYAGILITDGEVMGRTSAFSWEGPWGTAASPAIFRRITVHDGETYRWGTTSCGVVCYAKATDTYNTKLDETGTYAMNTGTHGPAFGDTVNLGKNFIVENMTVWGTTDGLRTNCSTNCVVRNNTIRSGNLWVSFAATSAAGSVTLYNNIVSTYSEPLLCRRALCAEIASSGNNTWLHGDGETVASDAALDVSYTLTQLQDAGLETNSTSVYDVTNADLVALFNDPSVVPDALSGGDDYRLKAGSSAVDSGNNANCAHVASIVNSTCDRGAYEYLAGTPTGPNPIHSEAVTPGSETGGGAGDITDPVVTITAPTSAATYETDTTPLTTLAGTCTDDVEVNNSTWSNDQGGSGAASGQGTWLVASIPLQVGPNVITVTCYDTSNNTHQDSITVTYTPVAPPPGAAGVRLRVGRDDRDPSRAIGKGRDPRRVAYAEAE